jgi:thiamine biosynthesis protein ThiC
MAQMDEARAKELPDVLIIMGTDEPLEIEGCSDFVRELISRTRFVIELNEKARSVRVLKHNVSVKVSVIEHDGLKWEDSRVR